MKTLPWMSDPLPQGISRLQGDAEREAINRSNSLVQLMSTPSREYPKRSIYWPKPPLTAVLIAGGLLSLQGKEDFDASGLLEKLFVQFDTPEVMIWAIGEDEYGVYTAQYSEKVLLWIRNEVILSPICILHKTMDVILITEEQLHFSVLGASTENIMRMQSYLDDNKSLNDMFAKWVASNGIGFGSSDREWAEQYLMK